MDILKKLKKLIKNDEKTLKQVQNDKKKKAAFTLAEVLITIGIIGVVAALTIPSLIQNYQKKVVSEKAKTSYAMLLQAIRLSEADNGDFNSWNFNIDNSDSVKNTTEFFDTYIKPYLKGASLCSTGSDRNCGVPVSGSGLNYTLSNGTMMSLVVHPGQLYIIIDTNGKNKPNKLGTDTFYFSTHNEKHVLMPHGWYDGVTRDEILARTDGNQCNKSNDTYARHGCTLLLYLDDWKMKNDYPYP